MKPIITLKPLYYKDKSQIAIGFSFNEKTKSYIKKFQGVNWSKTHSTYYVAHNQNTLHELFTYLRKGEFYIDYKSLKYVRKEHITTISKVKSPDKLTLFQALSKEQKTILKEYVAYLRGKRLSESTVSSYGFFILRFLNHHKTIDKSHWNTRSIETFIEQVISKEYYSISSHRQCVSAFKHFTVLCNLENFDASNFERPKKSNYLPIVLSKEAIIDLMQVTKNLKHRTIIGLLYSGGLRIGELLNLKLNDLDLDRSQIHIKQAKGRKDRVVGMSEAIKPLLYNYVHTYRPEKFLIEGRDGDKYSASSIRFFLKQACKLAGITKPVTPHTLRHSYATHMLENGIDLRYIQALLGHVKPETTMIYTHVAKKDILKIRNPLDVMIEEMQLKDKDNKKVLISRNFKD
ncbi:tyrosine-type recombinase/integrase [Xanthomarina sp. F2636L]|uniref:tyrosine-type recombinase/integrase n=1 Tax=Xanthomarina sp. F2636L TaxID=2996018 RepID=UPI00225DD5C6|nr:tyrosine-type recombinase/integrase [Xanthomarina sp. F2636L]MCX7552085.1 tyrosine-type recombinase/integrase [Xanthomarina sp. F2636L]